MTVTPDDAQRERILTELGEVLLVEAAAGTGKTSLLAGRVAMLLAAGRDPASIAAITFTERAAAELRNRVDKFATILGTGVVPEDLEPAFRTKPPREEQLTAIAERRSRFGELTACTIHAFCLTILQSYAVEARVDPGAAVMDAEETDLAFDSVFDNWLGRRLGSEASEDDPIVLMAAHDPVRAVRTLRNLAKFRRAHPDARTETPPSFVDAIADFQDAVGSFQRWLPGEAPLDAQKDVGAFEELAASFRKATGEAPRFSDLYGLVRPSNAHLFGRNRVKPYAYKQRLGAWRDTAGDSRGDEFSAAGRVHYEYCVATYERAAGAVADSVLARFFGETDGLVAAFDQFKADAAVLDFDDILIRTRNLLRTNRKVREDVSARYSFILVDEFQDTNPIQCEILFLIASEAGDEPVWDHRRLRPGALFAVGDPKQSLYRFRGADLDTYVRAKQAIRTQFPRNTVEITANFRSRKPILDHVDLQFAERLGKQRCGYRKFDATIADDRPDNPAIAQHPYPFTISSKWYLDDARDADALEVARLCASIVGNLKVRRSDGSIVIAEPGDIALLAPTSTDLWRYERALEDKGLPVASQAGKNLYRRQEVQDFVALVRAIADSRDTLALGAVLRGPIVGLTDHELLDIAAALDEREVGPLTIQTDPQHIEHPLGREVIRILQDLWRKRRGTSPHALLSEALERLRVLASVGARFADQRARSVGNMSSLMERVRNYDVLGLKQLAVDLGTEWGEGELFDEAPADHRGDAIEIVTIHKAKGLEWPVVIPVNLAAMPSRSDEFFFRPGQGIDPGTVHWTFGEIASSTLAEVLAADAIDAEEERERQLYVACTRAIDCLIIPAPTQSPEESWLKFFDLDLNSLPAFRLPASAPGLTAVSTSPAVAQSAEQFADEASRIASLPRIVWRRPSEADADRTLLERATVDAAAVEGAPDTEQPVVTGAGPLRGTVLHSLMEELLVGTIAPDLQALAERATSLMDRLSFGDLLKPSAHDLARVALKTFNHEQLAAYRDHLVPEFPLYGSRPEGALVSARADAVAIVEGAIIAVFDWKSDADPSGKTRLDHRVQLLEYLSLSGASTGAVIYAFLDPIEFDVVTFSPETSGKTVAADERVPIR